MLRAGHLRLSEPIVSFVGHIVIILTEHAGSNRTLLTCIREVPGSNLGRGCRCFWVLVIFLGIAVQNRNSNLDYFTKFNIVFDNSQSDSHLKRQCKVLSASLINHEY